MARDIPAENRLEHLGDNNAVLLANHMVLVVGPKLSVALGVAETVEVVACDYCRALHICTANVLTHTEMKRLINSLATYGQPTDRLTV